eukprot:Pgem_evm1s10367
MIIITINNNNSNNNNSNNNNSNGNNNNSNNNNNNNGNNIFNGGSHQKIISLTGERGRGKSSVAGLALIAAVCLNENNSLDHNR